MRRRLLIKSLIRITALFSIINGIAYLLFVRLSLSILGIQPDPGIMMVTRYYGACAIGYGLLLWWIVRIPSPSLLQAGLFSILVTLGPSILIGVLGLINGVINQIGWLFVITDFILSATTIFLLIRDSSFLFPSDSR